MKLRIKSEQGIAHVALIAVVAVAVVAAGAGLLVLNKNKGQNEGKLKADAAGAYSSICGSGYNLKHTQDGYGFKLYNYKNAAGRGCALTINDNWGAASTLYVGAGRSSGRDGQMWTTYDTDGPKTYRYYAGPIYYPHDVGVVVSGEKNGHRTSWKLTTE